MLKRVGVALCVVGDVAKTLTHASAQLAVFAAPAALVHLNEGFERVRQTRQVRLSVQGGGAPRRASKAGKD